MNLVDALELLGNFLINSKGCQKVAGGRSVAQTTDKQRGIITHPGRVPDKRWHPSGVRSNYLLLSGGLRYVVTTGYYLSRLRREDTLLHRYIIHAER